MLWAIGVEGSGVLSRDGFREYEPSPSNRSDEFKRQTRFKFDEAIQLAKEFILSHKPYDKSAILAIRDEL